MVISCPKCGHQGKVDPSIIPPQGANARCPRCQNRFLIKGPDTSAPAPSPPSAPGPAAPAPAVSPPPPQTTQVPEPPQTQAAADPPLGFADDGPAPAAPSTGGLSLKESPGQASTPKDVACHGCLKLFKEEEVVLVGDQPLCKACQESFQAKGETPAAVRARPVSGMTVKKQRMEFAGFWVRLGAYAVDVFLLFLVWHFAISPVFMKISTKMLTDTTVPLTYNIPQDSSFEDPEQMEKMVAQMQDSMNEMQSRMIVWVWTFNLVGLLIMAGYFIVLEGGPGQTIGKKALNLRVVTPEGDQIGYLKALARYVGRLVSALILGIGFIMIAFDGEKRALHDRMCETRVVKD